MTISVDATTEAAIATLTGVGPGPQAPTIPLPPDGELTLPGGYLPDPLDLDTVVYHAEVRELTGADEAVIEKARRRSVAAFYNAIINAGTLRIGDQEATDTLLGDLLLGDRDALVLAIRKATYGPEIAFQDAMCPRCQKPWDLVFDLDNVPVKGLGSSRNRIFDVPLKRQGVAAVRLPTGADQAFAWSDGVDTLAEGNSRLLSRVVLTIADNPVTGNISMVNNLSIVDRVKILDEISARQVGPQYDEAVVTHDACGEEVPVAIQIGDLFPGL